MYQRYFFIPFSAKFKKIFIRWVVNNIVRYRYNYVDMNFRAVEDFCKGIDWFMAQEAEPLHKEISVMNYKSKPKSEFIGYKGITEADYDWEMLNDPHQLDPINKIKKYFRESLVVFFRISDIRKHLSQ